MPEIGKFNLKINVMPNVLETTNNKLTFIDSFQFLASSLDSLVKKIRKDGFKYSSQEFDHNVFDLVKEKGLYPNEYIDNFRKLQELPSKEKV